MVLGKWGNDEQILAIVSSANIACGFHAGDPVNMLNTLKQAAAQNVSVERNVSYPDRVGFGRRNMDVSYDELYADVLYQISALQGLALSLEQSDLRQTTWCFITLLPPI